MSIKVFMIVPDKGDDPVSQERWRQAEESLSKAGDGFVIERIAPNAVLALGKTTSYSRDSVFITSKFEGKPFDHLISLGCRVYGSPCILQCIDKRTSLPRRYHAIFAQVLTDVLVCCSSLERDEKERIFKIVRWLGGDYKLDLTSEVTHLVTNKVGSPKYTAFLRLNKPIVTTAWIEEMWKTAQNSYPINTDLSLSMSAFLLPAFAGLVVCTSGLKDEERRYFKQLIEKHGGTFTGQLKQYECTHLIVRELHGEKYKFASQWGNIKIVSPTWLLDSVHADCCLPEESYVIYGPRPPLPEDVVSQAVEPVRVEKSGPIVGTFMSNCSVYLLNLSIAVADELKKMVVAAGGMCVVEPLEVVTHVVASDQDLEEAENIVATQCSMAHIVSPDWIRKSFVSSTMLDELSFQLVKKKSSTSASFSATSVEDVPYADMSVIGVDNNTTVNTTVNASRALDVSVYLQSFRRIALDGFKAKSDRLTEALGVLKKIDCDVVHINSLAQHESVDLVIVPFGQSPSPSADRLIKSGIVAVNSLFFEIVKNAWERHTKNHRTNVAALQPLSLHKLMPDLEEHLSNSLVNTLNAVTPCLESCCITLTGFDYPERALLVRLVIALGAAHQEMFARTATVSTSGMNSSAVQLQRSTHLVAAKAAGEKYEKAKRWDVPVLKRDWLLDCWRLGARVSEQSYSLASPVKVRPHESSRCIVDVETSLVRVEEVRLPLDKEDSAPMDRSVLQTRLTSEIQVLSTPEPTEKTEISRRLDAILAASKLSVENASRRARQSPAKTPKTPMHRETNFIVPHRPAMQSNYGVESSQSLQVMWGDDCASNRFSLGIERIEEETGDTRPPSSARLRSLMLVEDALSSPNGSLHSGDVSTTGHPKCSPLQNCNSNSEPVVIRAPDAVVIAPAKLQRTSAFPVNHKANSSNLAQENVVYNAQSPPVFQFSGLSPSERDDAAALLERLGAKVTAVPISTMAEGVASLSDAPLDSACTHLIVSEPSRTQKFLSGIAGGKWILHRSYIDACRVENRLVDESPFEWGSDRCAEPPQSACKGDIGLAKRLAAAAHRWRNRLSGTANKAFSDWRVILLIFNQQTEQSCRQILVSGGASVISLPVDYSAPAASSFTHWLVDPSITQHLSAGIDSSSGTTASPARQARYQLMRRSYDCLMRFLAVCGGPESPNGGGRVFKYDYIQAYLLADPMPNYRQFLVNVGALTVPSLAVNSPARKVPSSSSNDSDFVHADKRLRTVVSAARPYK